MKLVLIGVAIALLVSQAFAQGFSVESKSPPSVVGAGPFVSLEGRFSIALPAGTHGYRPVALDTQAGKLTGDAYNWTMKEGSFTAGFADAAQPIDDAESVAKIFGNIRDGMSAWANSKNGKLASDRQFEMDKHPALEVKLEFPEGNLWQRFCVESNRIFQLVLLVKSNQSSDEAVALKVLDSFKILSAAEVSAALKAKAAAAEPDPLPQEPVAARAGSDARDDRLRGEVKTVLEESESLTGTSTVSGRKPNSMKYYNKAGNLTKQELYDYKGNLSQITVYGYIDGARVSNFKTIERNYNPPPVRIAPSPGAAPPKFDPRYANKYTFLYDDQKRLIEKTWFMSNGETTARDVYKYSGNQLETLFYSGDGSLNRRFFATVDDKGNKIEETQTSDGPVKDKYSYAYEFDAKGNWTKRVTSKWVTKDGKSSFVAEYILYRTLTYY
ncbi:MAG TPA: hypothetical protein VN724_00420 [Pyrinomonadaceae bacterium]|nr:hypothetical protein [Pyrinomonadaceae bacterium]